MKYDYDLICIGMGPAGMAVSAMAAEMGLKVCAIEKNKIGGECMNVGCIPSKSILRISKYRYATKKLAEMGLTDAKLPDVKSPFPKIAEYLEYVSGKKTLKMFDKVHLLLGEGSASFVDDHTVKVTGVPHTIEESITNEDGKPNIDDGSTKLKNDEKCNEPVDKTITAQKIFIATGTEPMVPPINGLKDVDYLTNINLFQLEKVPKSMTIIGGGAIGCEIAQAFSRLGTKCSIVQMDNFLLPIGDKEAGELLQKTFEAEGIDVHNSEKISSVTQDKENDNIITLTTESGLSIKSEQILVAAGRRIPLKDLNLEKAGVTYNKRCIEVDRKFRTSKKHIYAVGDCNGGVMLSHAAMHQGMSAVMNAVSPFSIGLCCKPAIPWTVFSDPQVSHVGLNQKQLKVSGIKYETHTVRYEDYGAAIAENIGVGYVKVFTSSWGRVYGVSIVGDGSGEMINEWALVIQKKIRLHSIMFLAHSFPTMGFLSKRVAEVWMMSKMQKPWIQKIAKYFYRNL